MQVLHQLPRFVDPNLLVGGETMDDAGVYVLNPDQAVVLTIDVLTPIAEDPYTFGQIVAANSLSDIYAMAGRPIAALCFISFPVAEIAHETIHAILNGVWDKVREAGAVIVGGHTIKDNEVKCGLAVTGLVHPKRIITNAGAQPGDILLLTKPLGIGIITTALRVNLAQPSAIEQVNRVMTQLNSSAAAAIEKVGVNAATDVTGFGLLGHAWEMAQASKVDLVIHAQCVPIIAEAFDLAQQSLFPEGSVKNYEFMKSQAEYASSVSDELQMLLCDAQTSGGLLISVPAQRSQELLDRLHQTGVFQASAVGEVRLGQGKILIV